ncbi:MAG: hypothetical protein AB2L14_16185 [Candidatus Xenobiia bacterium LiM19]
MAEGSAAVKPAETPPIDEASSQSKLRGLSGSYGSYDGRSGAPPSKQMARLSRAFQLSGKWGRELLPEFWNYAVMQVL